MARHTARKGKAHTHARTRHTQEGSSRIVMRHPPVAFPHITHEHTHMHGNVRARGTPLLQLHNTHKHTHMHSNMRKKPTCGTCTCTEEAVRNLLLTSLDARYARAYVCAIVADSRNTSPSWPAGGCRQAHKGHMRLLCHSVRKSARVCACCA